MKVLLSGLSADRVELNLAKSLFNSGIDLFIIAAAGSPAVNMCIENNIPHAVHEFRSRIDRKAVALYRELHAAHSFDIFHCLTNRSLSTGLAAIRTVKPPPKIVAYRGTMGHLSWFDPASHISYLNRRLDCIICVSGAVRTYLKAFRIPDKKLEVIWKGHDPSWYSAAPREVLSGLGIPPDAVAVSFTGNIRPVKGVDYLLKAFDGFSPGDGIHLVVIGEVRDKAILKLADKNPLIHFTGFRADATALAGACDIAVMPSVEREGLPKAVIESMAQAIPAVVTNVGGLPELVVHGECGLVIPPRDADALREALKKLAHDRELRATFGRAAQARIHREFNFRETLRKTQELYTRLAADHAT